MTGLLKKGKYNSSILCASSIIYFFVGIVTIPKDIYLSILLFIVMLFSVLHHGNFKNFDFKFLDWTFGMILAVYLYYLVRVKFDVYIFSFLLILTAIRLVDHVLFKEKRYGIFSYTHSLWHLLSGLIIVFIISYN
ncbi:MAG: hypothetical protein A2566_02560 [Candidatus Zambryskibacteria bacterium RIFOXYD1_FULL_40_13]|nr:MAG: hypothetical protein UT25_C0007G0002 [Parcubacteria group bacterium GW2011_GWC1_39_12]KKR18602.1 MAG: hypothetical protein UT49_C0006G0011 [Parcubacteria group bacterium GW2011_GWF1_39_37]KKR34800.1 MAG: hypothetical protein UT68_C0008G0013 [Parcubacteria group bacterium GW2011_GWC2_40_10]KKR52743.1 MAG: hypothetical protein UT89_C0001G0251 [Parcubacteria group bacterium GW2011_GWE1_40_20]KKR69077.1 MAG: hypothetical protein UU11_C0003G0071 [Parcubacteria group bacterium GW2011_GWF2_40_